MLKTNSYGRRNRMTFRCSETHSQFLNGLISSYKNLLALESPLHNPGSRSSKKKKDDNNVTDGDEFTGVLGEQRYYIEHVSAIATHYKCSPQANPIHNSFDYCRATTQLRDKILIRHMLYCKKLFDSENLCADTFNRALIEGIALSILHEITWMSQFFEGTRYPVLDDAPRVPIFAALFHSVVLTDNEAVCAYDMRRVTKVSFTNDYSLNFSVCTVSEHISSVVNRFGGVIPVGHMSNRISEVFYFINNIKTLNYD